MPLGPETRCGSVNNALCWTSASDHRHLRKCCAAPLGSKLQRTLRPAELCVLVSLSDPLSAGLVFSSYILPPTTPLTRHRRNKRVFPTTPLVLAYYFETSPATRATFWSGDWAHHTYMHSTQASISPTIGRQLQYGPSPSNTAP